MRLKRHGEKHGRDIASDFFTKIRFVIAGNMFGVIHNRMSVEIHVCHNNVRLKNQYECTTKTTMLDISSSVFLYVNKVFQHFNLSFE